MNNYQEYIQMQIVIENSIKNRKKIKKMKKKLKKRKIVWILMKKNMRKIKIK